MPEGIFGGIFDQSVHLRDSRHAAEAYGFNKADLSNGTPRHKFEFFLRINFNRHPDVIQFVRNFLTDVDQEIITTMVKSVTMPSMQVETETLNQYNKKRISQTRIDYAPVTITMHDSVEGRTLRLWEMYYEYYFRDGVASEKLDLPGNQANRNFLETLLFGPGGVDSPKRNTREYENDLILDRFNDNYGYNLERVGNNKYLIDSIEIFQIHGGRFSRTELVRPRINAFTHDTLDYEDSTGLVEMRFDFAYEGVIYANINEKLNADELERFRFGDFWEMANLITIRTPVRGRTITEISQPNTNTCGPGQIPLVPGILQGNLLFDVVGDFIGDRNVARITDSITGVVGSVPGAIGAIASASIFGGEVTFNPDPLQALRTTGSQVGRSVINRGRGNFTAAVAGTAANVISGIFGG